MTRCRVVWTASPLVLALVAPLLLGAACTSDGTGETSPTTGATVAVTAPDGSVVLPTFDTASPELGRCAQVGVLFHAAYNQLSLLTGGAATDEYERARQQFDELELQMPPELAESFTVLHRAVNQFVTSAAGANLRTPEGIQTLSDASALLDSPVVHGAVEEIDEWFLSNCRDETFGSVP